MKQLSLDNPFYEFSEISGKINLNGYKNKITTFYVVEGSMMGGLLIRKNLEACTHLEDIEQHHFFGKSAPEVMQRWKAFTQAVESKNYTKEEQQQAVDGAHTAFNIFKDSYSFA